MGPLEERIARTAEDTSFSGVVRVDRAERTLVAVAHGHANRPEGVPTTVGTRFGIASGTKAMTALAVMSLIADGVLHEGTTARSLLGDDLPLVEDGVTVEHLLGHTSGIGDYLDESGDLDITEYVLEVPVHRLGAAEDYLAVVDGYPSVSAPGARFRYCNGGYVVLALLAERAAGVPYHDLVAQRVCGPAGMTDAVFARSDDMPAGTAVGYLGPDSDRTNVLHLPLRGVGDGGLYCTVADMAAFWRALFAGQVVPPDRVAQMVTPRSEDPDEDMRYGLGFWLGRTGDAVLLEGYDPGISFRSCHDPATGLTWTVVSNTSEGAWPMAREVAAALADLIG